MHDYFLYLHRTKEIIMMKIRRFILPLFIVLFISHSVYATKSDVLTVYNFDEFEHWLHKETDSIYVINFWATWCAPCVREIPYFEELYANYKEEGLRVILVSLDNPDHLESRVIPFIENHNLQSEVILLDDVNANRWIPLVSEEWSGAIPATVIYNNSFRAFYEKEFKYDELEEIVLPLL